MVEERINTRSSTTSASPDIAFISSSFFFTYLDCPNLISMPLFPNLEKLLYLNDASLKPLQQTMAMASSLPSSSSSPLFQIKGHDFVGIKG
jgi:hypothetical protein